MRTEKIQELVRILESHDIGEIEIRRWGSKIRISKFSASGNRKPPTPVTQDYVVPGKKEVPEEAPAREGEASALKDTEVAVKTPIVGTFYNAPAPDAEPYVKVGDHISVGQPLCIIEAMKIMNVIESEVSGTLKKILVENAQPVEYNQALFIIDQS